MNNEELTKITARLLYSRLPFWKRWQFRKWKKSNNWDVKDIYTRCLREADAMVEEEKGFNFTK